LSLVDVLARRYDVVAANPPYMGSKNMGAVAKRHLERHFSAGKRDLYAAFVLRCRELAADAGRVAMVTQQSWMFLRSYRALRTDILLSESTVEVLAHFGAKAFGDGPQGFDFGFCAFVVSRELPAVARRLTAFRLVGPK